MSNLALIDKIKEDCSKHGHGRKKWWAKNLGVHQQTVSYWLNGKRKPNGIRFHQIENILSILNDNESKLWLDLLFQLYFTKAEVNSEIIAEIITKVLSAEALDSRTLAFLSLLIKECDINKFKTEQPLLRNRLGWLLEISGKKAPFKPSRNKTMPLVNFPGENLNNKTIKYLKNIQTNIGKRWHLYDCQLDKLRGSFVVNFLQKTTY